MRHSPAAEQLQQPVRLAFLHCRFADGWDPLRDRDDRPPIGARLVNTAYFCPWNV